MLRSKRPALLIASVVLAFAAWVPSIACAQDSSRVVVSIYHVAPGKHLDFLRWQAARDAVAAEAGIGATQWYAHLDGDSWDYVSIAPATTDEQDDKVDAILKRKNLTTGYKGALELRTMIASHTDTYARGPTTAAALADAGK